MTDKEDDPFDIGKVFDLAAGKALKERGMALAAGNNEDQLELAREIALEIAMTGDGTCSADDVGKVLMRDYGIETLGPAAGSIFKQKEVWYHRHGEIFPSERKKSHGHFQRKWRLIGC